MSAPIPGSWVLGRVFARAFLIQGSWNYHTMLGSGLAFAILPALRELYGGDRTALRAAIERHVEHFNAHPYLANLALGAVVRLEAEGADAETIRRFKMALRSPLGSLGDSLVWASWLPGVSLASLALAWSGVPGWLVLSFFLVAYNVGHLLLRVWAFRTGLREGTAVGARLRSADLGRWSHRIRSAATLTLGAVAGLVLGGAAVPGEGRLVWAGLAAVAFTLGLRVGQRAWRPAAATVVAIVALIAAYGVFAG